MAQRSIEDLIIKSVVVSLVFTFLDYVVHHNPILVKMIELIKNVPTEYYVNNFIYTAIIIFVIEFFAGKISFWIKAIIISFIIGINYYFTTNSTFYFVSWIVHVLLLAIIFYLIDKKQGGFFG